jgi:hypothetical protein
MRLAILLAMLLAANSSVMAAAVSITSPDHAHTFAYGEMISHQLYFDRTTGELVVQITFSNQPYADCNDLPTYEPYDFRFPGVQFDSARHLFFAKSAHDERIPVARFGRGLVFSWVDLSPGAKIYLVKDHGRVTAILTATSYPRAGTQWVQTDNNLSLQNILIALFGPLCMPPDR